WVRFRQRLRPSARLSLGRSVLGEGVVRGGAWVREEGVATHTAAWLAGGAACCWSSSSRRCRRRRANARVGSHLGGTVVWGCPAGGGPRAAPAARPSHAPRL